LFARAGNSCCLIIKYSAFKAKLWEVCADYIYKSAEVCPRCDWYGTYASACRLFLAELYIRKFNVLLHPCLLSCHAASMSNIMLAVYSECVWPMRSELCRHSCVSSADHDIQCTVTLVTCFPLPAYHYSMLYKAKTRQNQSTCTEPSIKPNKPPAYVANPPA